MFLKKCQNLHFALEIVGQGDHTNRALSGHWSARLSVIKQNINFLCKVITQLFSSKKNLLSKGIKSGGLI